MSGKVFFVMASFLLMVSFKPYEPGTPGLERIQSAYKKADGLFNHTGSGINLDTACMKGFREVIALLQPYPRSRISDSLRFQSYYKLGVLCEENLDYPGAIASYLQALHFSATNSDRFRMYTLTGSGYYNLNNFDSATYFLLGADEIPGNAGTPEDRVRMFNTLGVLYYDNGNYLQSKNYFTQALRLIEGKSLVKELKTYIQLNLATCSYKLGLYDQTLKIYLQLEQENLLPDPLYLNMGKAYSGLREYGKALRAFRKVKISSEPGVLNEMAKTALATGNRDSAQSWLLQFQKEKKLLKTNQLDEGVNALYFGKLELEADHPEAAIRHLQEALILFSRNFTSSDTRKNPGSFTGSFAYYRLFEVLATKAAAWESVYKITSSGADLKSAYDSYESAIALLSYIERSYEMDDAKILLKGNSSKLLTDALNVCLRLNAVFPKENFLEKAFLISEKSKASVMGSQIREAGLLHSGGSGNELAAEERNIKYNIARLNSKIDEGGHGQSLQSINDEKSAYETRLVNLRRKMDDNKQFYQLKYSDDFPTVSQLKNRLDKDQILISFFNEPDKINIFFLTKSSLRHLRLDSGARILKYVREWIDILQTSESGKHVQTASLKKILFEELMKPVMEQAGNKPDWIIVPDGLFFLLPFESLPMDAAGNTVIEKHAVSYEFSSRFILEKGTDYPDAGAGYAALAFAPFSKNGANLESEGMGRLDKLPFSKSEIGGLKGVQFIDLEATKERFLQNVNHYPIVHLATHAMTDLQNSSASNISFFPSGGIRSEDFLFLDEIYALRMDSCKMIVISACETGKGALVSNEGVMSFARAFLYAGCPSTINTLWKADDRSTAEILAAFYKNLESGDSKSVALQKAKKEFIRNNPVYRNPAYWAHIVIMGNADPLYKKKQPWLWVVGAGFGTMLFFLNKKRKGKKVDVFHS